MYLLIGDDSKIWGAIFLVSQYFAFSYNCYSLIQGKKTVSILERVIFRFCIFFNLSLSLLTVPCIWGNEDWVKPVVYWYTVFMGVIFVLSLCYGWIKHTDELGKLTD